MFSWYSEGSSAREDQTGQTEGNTAEEKRALYLSISSNCQVLLVALAVPSRSHSDKERTLQPAAAIWNNASSSWDVQQHLPQNLSRMCNLITITQQPNSPLQSSDRKCRLTHLHLSDGVIARLHIQMSICLTVWYTDRAYTLEAKFTPVVISLTPVAITQRTNLAHSVS